VKVLPSASIRYALTNSTNLRLAYSRGLSRPDPQDIAQAATIDNTASPILVTLGNPSLRAETADNVDVLVEHYINPFGMIEAGYFYKNLKDPIIPHTFTATRGNFAKQPCTNATQWLVTKRLNAATSCINGFEAAY